MLTRERIGIACGICGVNQESREHLSWCSLIQELQKRVAVLEGNKLAELEPQVKVGDRVQVVECAAFCPTHIGLIGIVKEVGSRNVNFNVLLPDGHICCASKVRLVPEKPPDSAQKKLEDYFRGAVCECWGDGHKTTLTTCSKCRKGAVKEWLKSKLTEAQLRCHSNVWGIDWLLTKLEKEEK